MATPPRRQRRPSMAGPRSPLAKQPDHYAILGVSTDVSFCAALVARRAARVLTPLPLAGLSPPPFAVPLGDAGGDQAGVPPAGAKVPPG